MDNHEKKYLFIFGILIIYVQLLAQEKEVLIYHPIEIDQYSKIIPWYDENLGKSYDHAIDLVWNFWDNMRRDLNGLPNYINHQVWNPNFNEARGIGGDQFAMAKHSVSI